MNTQQGEFGDRDFDTRIEERPTKSDLNNINKTIAELMKQHQVSQLKLQYPDPACVTEEGEVIPGEKLKSHLRKERELRLKGDEGAQKWQGKLVTAREVNEELNI